MKINFQSGELAVLIKAFYEMDKGIDPSFFPQELYFDVADELCRIVDDWEKVGISFFEWCANNMIIYPVEHIDKEELESWKQNQLYMEWDGLMISGWLGDVI